MPFKIFQRINVPLTEQEASALIKLADSQCRHPREQARYILHLYLAQKGYLDDEGASDQLPNSDNT
jgi:hypothetical protein